MAVLGPFDFTGGYSPGYDFVNYPKQNYASIMKHCRIKGDYIVPRWSWNLASTISSFAGGNILGMTVWTDTVNSVPVIACTDASGKFWMGDITGYYTGLGNTIVMTNYSGAVAANAFKGNTTFDSLNNILVGTGNSSASGSVPFQVTAHNTNAANLSGSPPSADCVKQCNNFMFLARNLSSTTTQSTLYWSNVNDPQTWTGTNVLNISKNDGEPIMALGTIGATLYIFKQSSIWSLSCVTITTSGAVTLGPLVRVIKGTGCCGPNALDNLPNGNIVFVSMDGHLYEFDGSTLVDWSDQPSPGPKFYESGQYSGDSSNSRGIKEATPNTGTYVRTLTGQKEVWISYNLSYATANSIPFAIAFNYDTHRCQGYIGYDSDSNYQNVYSMAPFFMGQYVTNLVPSEGYTTMFMGNSSALFVSGYQTKWYPTLGPTSNPTLTFMIGTIINLGGESTGFIPRSLVLEVHTTASVTDSLLGAFNVYVDYDKYEATTNVYTSTSSSLPARIVIPLNHLVNDSIGSNVLPATLAIKISGSGTGSGFSGGQNPDIIRIGRFWLSDEIVR